MPLCSRREKKQNWSRTRSNNMLAVCHDRMLHPCWFTQISMLFGVSISFDLISYIPAFLIVLPLPLYFFQLSAPQKGLANYLILVYWHFTQHPSFWNQGCKWKFVSWPEVWLRKWERKKIEFLCLMLIKHRKWISIHLVSLQSSSLSYNAPMLRYSNIWL